MQINPLILIFSIVFIISCNNRNTVQKESDTTEAVRFAIKNAFLGYLPDQSSVKRRYRFGDSILFTSDSISLNLLPLKIDSLNFKVLTQKEICSLILSDSGSENLPNYLSIKELTKTDSGFQISIASLSCFWYGGGGILFLDINKSGNSFYLKKRSSWSIN